MPRPNFTPAAERALAVAAGMIGCSDDSGIDLRELLLGLLAEPECRAAGMLAERGVDAVAVRRRWPQGSPHAPREESSSVAGSNLDLASEGGAGGSSAQTGGPPVLRMRSIRAFSPELETAIQITIGRLSEHPQPLELGTEHLLLALLSIEHEVSAWLQEHGFNAEQNAAEIDRLHGVTPGPLEFDDVDVNVGWAERSESHHDSSAIPVGLADSSHSTDISATIASPPSDIPLFRTLDAAANRAREGLRVVEDYVRFQLDDRHLTECLKSLRHRLTGLLARFPVEHFFAARETQADVGTDVSTVTERVRTDIAAVVIANFKRVQESLRSLEEFSKVFDAELATGLEQLRYEVYTLERAVVVTARSRERLAHARLYVLLDGRPDLATFQSLAESLIEAGVHVLQLRDKQLADRELLARARRLRHWTQGSQTLFIMNDRPDLAVLAGADGVHVGQEELTVKDARTIVGPDMLIGVSTHSIQQARQAVLDGADYLGVGPTFPSGTKRFQVFPGLEFVRQVAQEIRLPAFAIGGIDVNNVDQVLAAGLSRVALSGGVCSARDPASAARELLAKLRRVGPS